MSNFSMFKDEKEQVLFKTLIELKSKQERLLFLSQIQEHEKYTNAQRIYDAIYQQTRKNEKETLTQGKKFDFNPFQKDIDLYFPKEISKELRDILEQQRQAKQEFIKAQHPQLFHVSIHSPDEIEGGELQPRLQFEQFRDRGKVRGVFASPNKKSAFHIRGGKDNPVFTSDTKSDRIVLIADKEKFIKYNQKHPYTYQYEVANDSFEPNIGYDGHYHGEWISLKPVRLGKYETVSIEDIIKQGTQIYFPINPKDFSTIASKISKREKEPTIISQLLNEKKIIAYNPDEDKKNKIEVIIKKMSDFFIKAEKEVVNEKTGPFYTREEYQSKILNELGISYDLKKVKTMDEEERLRYDEAILSHYKEKTGKNLIDLSFALTLEEVLEKKIPKGVIGCTGTAKLFCHFAKQIGLDCSVVITSSVKDLNINKNIPPKKRSIINGHQVIGVQFSNGFYVFDPGALRIKDSEKSPTDLDNLEVYPKYFNGPSKIGDVDMFLKTTPCQIRAILHPDEFEQVKTYQALANLQMSGDINNSDFKQIPINTKTKITFDKSMQTK